MKLSARKLVHSTVMELPMTSMIDVVFLLLVFFMVTAAFIETERNLDSAIEVKKSSAAESQSDLEPAVVEIVPSGGRYVYKLGAREMTSEDELLEVLEQFPAAARADGAFVRVSDGAPFRMAAAAIQTAKTAGFLVVTYVPKRE
ncbi:MAG: biopolymer transporter ExbD [Planctomycetes bacterium]|nr:biopolymer transporter ExbD [Planctomycetota bacterium]